MKATEKASATPSVSVTPSMDQRASSSITWQAPEHEYAPKDVSWFWLSLIATLILIGFALWQKNFLFVVFIAVAWLVVVNIANRFPAIWEFVLDENGVTIRRPNAAEQELSKQYPWEVIEGFDIHEARAEYKELVLKIQSRFSPYVKMNIHASDEERIRAFLLSFLPEEEYEKSLADVLSDLVGF